MSVLSPLSEVELYLRMRIFYKSLLGKFLQFCIDFYHPRYFVILFQLLLICLLFKFLFCMFNYFFKFSCINDLVGIQVLKMFTSHFISCLIIYEHFFNYSLFFVNLLFLLDFYFSPISSCL